MALHPIGQTIPPEFLYWHSGEMQQVQRFLCSATGKDTTSRVATERGLVLHFQPHLKSLFQEHNLQELAEKVLPFSKIPGLQNPTIFQDYVSRTKDAFRKMFRHASTTPTVPPSPTTPVSAAALPGLSATTSSTAAALPGLSATTSTTTTSTTTTTTSSTTTSSTTTSSSTIISTTATLKRGNCFYKRIA